MTIFSRLRRIVTNRSKDIQGVIDALDEHIAILDAQGTIVAVNRAWKQFAKNNSGRQDGYVGVNYLQVCHDAAVNGAADVNAVSIGLQAVLDGTAATFQFEYPCHSPATKRWFVMHAVRLEDGALLKHANATARVQVEQALKTSQHNLQAIFDSLDTAFFLLNRNGSIEFFNLSALGMSQNLQKKEVKVGQVFSELVPLSLQDAFATFFQQALTGETVQHDIYVLETWFEASYCPVFEEGEVTGVCLSYKDITARKQAEEAVRNSEEQLARIFHHSPAPTFIVLLEDYRLIDANSTFLNLVRAERSAVIGQTVSKLKLIHNPEVLGIERSDEAPIFETSLRTVDGVWRTVIMETEKVEYMNLPCLLVTCIDISERKRTEEQLLQAVQEVMKDAEWLGRSLLEQLAKIRTEVPQPESKNLTKREREVLSLMAVGRTNVDIALKLGISHQTVRNYVTRIYDKLEVHSRAEAVVWARQHGLTLA